MFGQQFYYALLRKYTIAFGNLFNDIYIARTDDQGNVTQYIKVPLTYAGKDKMLAIVNANPEETKSSQIDLPIISFEMMGLTYDSSRKLDTLNRYVRPNASNKDQAYYIYEAVPYDIAFNVYIMVKNREDGTKIIEQILPNFKPNWDMTLNIIPQMGIMLDTPVLVGGITYEDKYDGQLTTQNPITWTISFNMQAALFGATKTKPLIKTSKQIYYFGNPSDNSDPIGELTITPGLTSNGQPTSVANQSIDIHQISITDDFGFVVTESNLNGIVFTGNT